MAKENNNTVPYALQKQFLAYKNALKAKDYKKLYDLQLPYFRYIHSYKEYKQYKSNFFDIDKYDISNIRLLDEKTIALTIGFTTKKNKNIQYFNQIWYNVGDKFFTKEQDIVLFKD